MRVRLDLAGVRRALILTVALLILLTFVAQVLKDIGHLDLLSRFIDSDQKLNFPSVYKELALLASALVVWAISRVARNEQDPWALHWLYFAIVIGVLALDEMTYAHQSIGYWLSQHIDFGGPLHFAWVVVYLPLALIVVVVLARFWWHLGPGLRWPLAAAGVLFGGGSGGIELVKGSIASDEGQRTLHFYLAAAISDSLEMIGLALLLITVLGELGRRAAEVNIEIEGAPATDSPPPA